MTLQLWTALTNGKRHAVIRMPQLGGGPPTFEMLDGTLKPDCRDWLKAFCPTYELAKRIAELHNADVRATCPHAEVLTDLLGTCVVCGKRTRLVRSGENL